MADNSLSMKYDLYQLNNDASSAHEKWFPRAVRQDTLSLRGLADHIAAHGSIYTRDVVEGVLTKFAGCMVELVQQGIGVKLNGLGTFYPTIEAKGANTPVDYSLAENFKGVHIRFLPDDSDLDKITSREMLKKTSFKLRMIFDIHGVPKKVKNGQLVDYGEDDNDEQNP